LLKSAVDVFDQPTIFLLLLLLLLLNFYTGFTIFTLQYARCTAINVCPDLYTI